MKQSGLALVEALVASSLLALGLLGASRLTLRALDAALQTRQQEQAQALVREALDCAQARSLPCPATAHVNHQGVSYSLQMRTTPLGPHLSEVAVLVQWRQGSTTQQLAGLTRVCGLPDWLGVSSP